MFNYIKIGNRAEISLERDGTKIKTYSTKVELIESKDSIFFSFPMSNGQYVKLPKIKEYVINFYTETGIFQFKASVDKYVKIEGLPFIKVSLLSEGKKVQRREFFRYEYFKDFDFFKLSEDEEELSQEEIFENMFNGTSKDIGAGGIRFLTNKKLIKDDKIKVFYEFDNFTVIVDAVVLDSLKLIDEMFKYQVRTKFLNLTEEDKEKIIAFIFNEQRKRLKRR